VEVVATLLWLGAVLCVVGGLVGLYVSRQRTLSRRVASFDCMLNPGQSTDGLWQPGIAQYAQDQLVWWRTLSLAPRPARVWSRNELDLVTRTALDQTDEQGRPLLVVDCRHRGEKFQVMISGPAYAGLLSWLESGPRRVGRVL
jgi:type II secretory pathway component PulM